MKTIQSIRQYLPAVTISLALFVTSYGASAQKHQNDSRNDDGDRKEHRNYENSNKDKNSKEYRNDRSNERRSKNEWHYQNEKSHDNRNWVRNDGDNEYRPRYSRQMNHPQRNYFEHPDYGRVYSRFDHNPIIFRHSHGNYFYSDNRFYIYRDGIGYCSVEPPRNVYFSELPFDCSRVRINGQVFFRNGDLFFQLSRRGYAIVPSPIEVRFSARF